LKHPKTVFVDEHQKHLIASYKLLVDVYCSFWWQILQWMC